MVMHIQEITLTNTGDEFKARVDKHTIEGLDPIQELIHDIKCHPKFFPDVDYRSLLKVLADISSQSAQSKDLYDINIVSKTTRPKFIMNEMIMRKAGFKDIEPKLLNIVVFDLIPINNDIDRIQLAIHASTSRPAHIGIRFRYKDATEWGFIGCNTNTVLQTFYKLNK